MTRLLWVFAWVAIAVWSLLAWGAYGLVDLFGWLLASGTDAGSAVAGIIGALRSLSQGAILFVWGLVSLAILAVPWLLARFARSGGAQVHVYHQTTSRRPGVIDLEPDQYSTVGTPRDPRPSPDGSRYIDPPQRR